MAFVVDERYWQVGISKVWWAGTIADPALPLASELDVDLTPDIGELAGWEDKIRSKTVHRWGQDGDEERYTGRVLASPVLAWYSDLPALDERPDLLADGVVGYLVLFPIGVSVGGPLAGDACHIRKVRSTGRQRRVSLSRTEGASWQVQFLAAGRSVEAVLG